MLGEHQGDEAELRRKRYGFGGPVSQAMESDNAGRQQPHFGIMLVTCEKADLRPSPDGVLVYDNNGVRDVTAIVGRGEYCNGVIIDELYDVYIGQQSDQ